MKWFRFNNKKGICLLYFIFTFCVLAELFRVPFDIPESESEIVAGFITEYASILFSFMVLAEYTNIILYVFFIIFIFCIYFLFSFCNLFIIALIRCSFNRLIYNELMFLS